MSTTLTYRSQVVKSIARQLGFSHCGIAEAGFLEEEAPRLEHWLKQGFQGEMHYMENHFDKRLDPRLLVDGARTVISLTYNYYTTEQQNTDAPRISKYAYGEDYHQVVKEKLAEMMHRLSETLGEIHGRVFVDSAPVMERAWAAKSGIGWIGKHSLLINKQQGSFFFLAEIIIDMEMAYDAPFNSHHCGTCTACIDACPTQAIVADKVVDGSKCISYFTIELKDQLPDAFRDQFDDWMFGCDVCQDVCPWNRFSIQHREPRFQPDSRLLSMNRKEWMEITEELFRELFRKSAVKRTKYSGLTRNIRFLTTKANTKD